MVRLCAYLAAPHPPDRQEGRRIGGKQPGQRAETGHQLARKVHGILSGGAHAQEHGQQFGV
jgi:hypothetical protein